MGIELGVHPGRSPSLGLGRGFGRSLAEGQDPAFFDDLLKMDQLLVRIFSEQGVPLLAGTDALIPISIWRKSR